MTSSGEVWKRHRRIIQPIFHRSRIAVMADRMAHVGEHRLASWKDQAGSTIDIAAEMMQLALEVISQTMFTTSMTQHIDRVSHALQVSIKYAFDSFSNPLSLPLWVPTARNREFRSVMQFMNGLMYGLLAERRRSGAHHDDLLDLLLQARDEETGEGLSDQELRDEALTILPQVTRPRRTPSPGPGTSWQHTQRRRRGFMRKWTEYSRDEPQMRRTLNSSPYACDLRGITPTLSTSSGCPP